MTKRLHSITLIVLVSLLSCNNSESNPEIIPIPEKPFFFGADMSYVNAIEDHGGTYKDENGNQIDPFKYLKSKGLNMVRVRLWHTPDWQIPLYGQTKYHHLNDVAQTISRAKKDNLQVCLDLHYSDNWADPEKQIKPNAWKNLDINTLKDSIYNYTSVVLSHLKSMNLTPEYIQVGNENNTGICHPEGKIVNNNFKNFGILVQSGISAVRKFSLNSEIKPKIILHVAQLQHADWWADGVINKAGIQDFDILGISHYFLWSTVNKNADISNTIYQIKKKYRKSIMIVETAYPWTTQSADQYPNIFSKNNLQEYPFEPSGQLNYMTDLTQALKDGGAEGIMYWEPCWISSRLKDQWGTGSSWENNTFFDFAGKPLPVVKYMQWNYK